jgi:hypothetical protein
MPAARPSLLLLAVAGQNRPEMSPGKSGKSGKSAAYFNFDVIIGAGASSACAGGAAQ